MQIVGNAYLGKDNHKTVHIGLSDDEMKFVFEKTGIETFYILFSYIGNGEYKMLSNKGIELGITFTDIFPIWFLNKVMETIEKKYTYQFFLSDLLNMSNSCREKDIYIEGKEIKNILATEYDDKVNIVFQYA